MTVTEFHKREGQRKAAPIVQPIRLSPLAAKHEADGALLGSVGGWQVVLSYDGSEVHRVAGNVGVTDVSARGKLLVQGEAAGTLLAELVAGTPDHHVIELAPQEWMLITPPGAEQDALQSLEATRNRQQLFVTVVDITGGLAGMVVAGPESSSLLSKLCALSFDPQDFPDRHSAQSSLAKVHALITRRDLGPVPGFALYVARSYADYVWEMLLDAGQAYGIVRFGWETLVQLSQENLQA